MLSLLIEDSEKRAVESLYTDRFLQIPEFTAGDARAVSCCPVKRIRLPWDSRVFSPKDPTAWTIQVALGGGFILPIAGTWPITYGANSSESILSCDPTANEISDALNGLPSVIAAGGVTVQGAEGFFTFTFNTAGARTLLSGNPSLLVPLSFLTFEQSVAGTVSTQEVQILRIAQNAGAFSTLETNTDAPTIAIDTLVAGGGGANCKIRINLPSDRYGGTWTFSRSTTESDQIGFDDNAAEIQSIIQAMGNIGSGNISVVQDDDDSFIVEFIGSLANTAISSLTADASALKTILYKSGVLDLRAPGIDMLLNGSSQAIVLFEVQATDETGYSVKILQRNVLLLRPILTALFSVDDMTYTKAQIDALTGHTPDITVSTAGTTDLAPVNPFIRWTARFIVQAGSGAYVCNITLDDAEAKDGAIFRIPFEIAASANPSINVYDNTTSGTLLLQLAGDSDNAQYRSAVFEFDGTNWHFVGFEQ